MKHPAHIERLIDERKELEKKITKLIAFIDDTAGELQGMNIGEYRLLCDQRAFMTAYFTVLDLRIGEYMKKLEEAARKLDMTMN